MNCDETRKHWHLFHDSEGDAKLHHQINEHLAMCAACTGWFQRQSRLEDGMVAKLRNGEPCQELWSSIRRQCLSKQPACERRRSIFGKIFVLAACVLIAAAGAAWYVLRVAETSEERRPELADLSVELHQKLTTGREAIKFPSRSDVEVEEYLRSQVNFPVRCPPRGNVGFQVEGGGVCQFNSAPVAYVIGRVDGRRVSVFIMEKGSLEHFPQQRLDLSGRESVAYRKGDVAVVMGQLKGNLVMVLGQIKEDRLSGILRSYGSYEERSHPSLAPDSKSNSA